MEREKGELRGERGRRELTNIQRQPLIPFRPSMLLYIAACNAPANMLPTEIVQALVSLNSQVLPYYYFPDAEEKRTKGRKRNREKKGGMDVLD